MGGQGGSERGGWGTELMKPCPPEWREMADILAALSVSVRCHGVEADEVLAVFRCAESRFSGLFSRVQDRIDDGSYRLAMRPTDRAGSLVTQLGAILGCSTTDQEKAKAVRDLAQEADAWVGRYKPATAAVEALADYSARSEDEPAAKVLKKAAQIRAKALKGIW